MFNEHEAMINIVVSTLHNEIKSKIKGHAKFTYFQNTDSLLITLKQGDIEYRHLVKNLTDLIWEGINLSTLSTRVINNYQHEILSHYFNKRVDKHNHS